MAEIGTILFVFVFVLSPGANSFKHFTCVNRTLVTFTSVILGLKA